MCENDFSVSYINRNTFMFSFENKDDFIKVLLDAPWSINGGLLIVSPWASAKTHHELRFSRSPFWVQVHGLPIEYLTFENANEIVNELGIPVRIDHKLFDKMPQWKNNLRVRVSVDVTEPLKTGFVLGRGVLPGVWVDFKYERLFLFCYNCGRIGHSYMSCKFSPSSAKFGPSLRAFTPFDYRYFGADQRVFGRRRSDLVVSPKLKPTIMNNSIVELWKKIAINSSVVMVMNSGMIFSSASLSNSYKYKWRLLIVIAGYLIYLARKVIFVLRRSSFVNEYEVMIPLAKHAMVAFLEILIFLALFLIFLFD